MLLWSNAKSLPFSSNKQTTEGGEWGGEGCASVRAGFGCSSQRGRVHDLQHAVVDAVNSCVVTLGLCSLHVGHVAVHDFHQRLRVVEALLPLAEHCVFCVEER